jgi:fused signal recognition particle receptor
MGLFGRMKAGMSDRIGAILASMGKVDEALFEQLEEALILADAGAETAAAIIDALRERTRAEKMTDAARIRAAIRDIAKTMLPPPAEPSPKDELSVILVVGVNGTGKTTSIGKLANLMRKQGRKVLIAAADTFRAAAIDQLQVWAERAGAELVKHAPGADPAAVVYDAIQAAKARGADVLICDTAGRLHTKKNLMEELAKIRRVIDRELPDASIETLLVVDATTGQNGIQQAREFDRSAGLTGIVLTKLDGTAKGGVVLSIGKILGVPVRWIGTGEKIDDIRPFDAEEFLSDIFGAS